MQPHYFEKSDGPLVYITYAEVTDWEIRISTNFLGNIFTDNAHVQNELIPEAGQYLGSLVTFECDMNWVKFIF